MASPLPGDGGRCRQKRVMGGSSLQLVVSVAPRFLYQFQTGTPPFENWDPAALRVSTAFKLGQNRDQPGLTRTWCSI